MRENYIKKKTEVKIVHIMQSGEKIDRLDGLVLSESIVKNVAEIIKPNNTLLN